MFKKDTDTYVSVLFKNDDKLERKMPLLFLYSFDAFSSFLYCFDIMNPLSKLTNFNIFLITTLPLNKTLFSKSHYLTA